MKKDAKKQPTEAAQSRAINARITVTKVLEFRRNGRGNLSPKYHFEKEVKS